MKKKIAQSFNVHVIMIKLILTKLITEMLVGFIGFSVAMLIILWIKYFLGG